jgi:hypothetical protein
MGIESGRLNFSWISSAEAGKFVDLVKEITDQVAQLGPADKLIKGLPMVDEYLVRFHPETAPCHSERSEESLRKE